MKDIYKQFSCNDFILDDDFRAWLNGNDHELDRAWETWLHANPAAREEVKKARVLLRALHIRERDASQHEVNAQWRQLDSLISGKIAAKQEKKSNNRSGLFSFWYILGAASIILIGVFAAPFFLKSKSRPALASIAEKTINGQQRDLILHDGTIVKLNAGSSLTYPQIFSDTIREVVLVGEAFFQVAKNADAPFIIHTGEVTTKVLGTEFNVSAYPENESVQIAVVSGKVKVKANVNAGSDHSSVCITKSEMVTFEKSVKELVVSKYDDREQLGWKDGILYFEKSDFSAALKKLERWYGVTIQVADAKVMSGESSWRFSGKFQNKPLDYILTTMSYPNRFSYTIKNKTVILNP
ncbi:FecR family protein [Dyadobacter sp. CY312]|uniref:FecR family protein n=1 Tax=Dyadobacter sp. CY312 TaxID=2907303 RepID=UPI001F1FA4FF|nr:FecR domain-containing protein [Dyadobacter sp. CY312]MCE7043211.1 FecR domain-containing protein [Dyadobacter sp. CY312]